MDEKQNPLNSGSLYENIENIIYIENIENILRFIYFLSHHGHMPCLFKERSILKSPDKIALENCLFINKYF